VQVIPPEAPYALPHLPSVDTFWEEAGLEDDADWVDVVPNAFEEDATGTFEQVPNFALHFSPQYAEDFPQYPCWLQQLPKALPWQVSPFEPAQEPSVETLEAVVATGGDEVVQTP
jgi:hypothetical protein